MDPSQHHSASHEHLDMQSSDPALHAQAHYGFYHPEPPQADQQPYPAMVFGAQQIPNYEVVPNAHQPQMAHNGLQQQQQPFLRNIGFNSLTNHHHPHHPAQGYPHFSPAHSSSSSLNLSAGDLHASPPPQSPSYDPLSPPVSGSDTSADGLYISRNSSGTTSPASSRGGSLVHRNSLRYNPTPSPSGSSSSRRGAGGGGGGGRGRSTDSDDDDPSMMSIQEITSTRKEATRRQRIEAEQRRRDELRDGYARLKDVLPVSNQKSSKVSLLERATNYIIQLDKSTRQMQTRLAALEAEVSRLRALNEKISLSVGGSPEAMGGAAGSAMNVHAMDRPLSPPPENQQQQQQLNGNNNNLSAAHNLIPVMSEPPREDSSGSENGL